MTATPLRPNLRQRFIVLLGFLVAIAATLCFGAPGALAAGGSAEIEIVRTNGTPQNSGAPTQYSINFSCSGVAATTCGEEPTIRIPLSLTAPVPAGVPSMETWKYELSSGVDGLVKEKLVEGGELVIKLDPTKLISGESDTIQLNVIPPNGTTPNKTAWALTPTFETEEIEPVQAKTAATGEAVATAQPAVSKKTLDEGAVYVRGHDVIFNITAQCAPGATTGKLFMTDGSLVDQLPEGLEYVSATPAPTAVVPPGGAGPTEIRWTYPDGESLPPGCGEGSTGSGTYQVTARVPATGADREQVVNNVTFSGTPIDEAAKQTSANVPLTLLNEAPTPGELGTAFLHKTSQAPLCIKGTEELEARSDCYAGTYPGHWITPAAASPGTNPGSAEGRFEVNIRYPASRAYETDLVDPMPCLDEVAAGEYSSLPVSGPVEPASVPVCAHPAFHPTAISVSAPSLAAALAEGWRPLAILTDGTPVPIALGSQSGSSAYFDIPAGEVGEVAAIELPRNPSLTDNQLKMNVFGYADGSLHGGEDLRDVAVASAYPIGSASAAGTASEDARIFIEPTFVQLGIKKTFGGLSNGPGGRTQLTTMNLVASLGVPAGKTLPGPVILADLLPEGMTWSNPAVTANFTVTNGLANSKTVAATITRDPNYQEQGRELIRVTLPAAPFEEGEAGGFFTIRPPANFFRMEVPNETRTFNNQAEIFVAGIERETQPVCGGGEGTGESRFQSSDPGDLSGTGEREQNYCEAEAPLAVNATGGPNFALKKFVQGDLDAQRKAALGVGKASRAGTGVFSLEWTNNGSAPLANAVVYDILPYVGDTGVDEGQSGNPRGSEFATEFVEVASLSSGVTVEYSTSTDPCRAEVNPAAAGTCVEDWSSTVPADAADVKALRFKAPGPFAPAASFGAEIKVKLPSGDVNDIAWNSAAADAETTAGAALRPAEPPKVGIEAPAPLVEPTVSTTVGEASILPEREVSDAVTVAGTTGLNGTVKWRLLGPVAPRAGSCEGLDWSGAAAFDEGSFPIAGDGTHSTATSSPAAHGCYAYETTVEGPGFETVTDPAGTAGELVLVHPATPSLETEVSAPSVLPGTAVSDSVAIVGTDEFAGTVKWRLFGPVAPAGNGCEGVDWTGAAVFDEGEFAVAADGTGTTATSAPEAHGCYGYEATVEGQHLETFVSPVGARGETVLVHPATPALATQVSSASILPGAEVADSITVTGTEGFVGSLSWRLAGPIAPAADGGCAGLDWSAAATVATGEIAVGGDLSAATPQTALTAHGCYGYEETIEGEHLATTRSPLGSAGETVLVHPAKPTLATTASPGSGLAGTQAADRITVGDTAGFAGTVHWKLVGPVSAAKGSCDAVDWNGAGPVAQGDLPVSGDGDLTTPGTTLTAPGCYGYQETIEGEHLATVSTPVGGPGETVLIGSPPAGSPDLKIVKRVDAKEVEAGKPLHFTIEVQNVGTGPATKVVVTDKPVTPLAFVAAKPSKGSCGHGFPLVCRLGTLAPGAKATIAVTATPTAGGKVENDATVSSPDDPAASKVKAAAASRSIVPLRLSKTVTPQAVEAGGRLHYTIAVTNPTVATAKGLQVCDRLPAGLAYVSSSLHAVLRKGAYCWRVASLPGHATVKIRVVARSLVGAAGKLVNTATLSGPDVRSAKATAAVRVKPRPVPEGGVTG